MLSLKHRPLFLQRCLKGRGGGPGAFASAPIGDGSGAATGICVPEADSDMLQLYIFETRPRALPAYPELGSLSGETFLRAVRRAAWLPWRDARYWRQAASLLAARPLEHVSGRELAQVCFAFNRIGFVSPVLANFCERYLGNRRQALNMFELAAVLAYVATVCMGSPGGRALAIKLADEMCIDWRQRETVPWTAWRMSVCALARGTVAHQALFSAAAPHLARNVPSMSGRDAADIVMAYATFGFKHHGLLSEMSRFVPSMGLTAREANDLRQAFARLGFDAQVLRALESVHDVRR